MRYATSAFLFSLLLNGAVVAAQSSTVTTDTKVKSDNGKVVTMKGCVEIGGGTSFLLTNITSEREKGDKQTSPGAGPYALVPREGLDLGPYINQQVELTGVVVPAATARDADDKIEVKETTTTRVEHGPDRKTSADTTVKVARGAASQFLVATVKTVAPGCQH